MIYCGKLVGGKIGEEIVLGKAVISELIVKLIANPSGVSGGDGPIPKRINFVGVDSRNI